MTATLKKAPRTRQSLIALLAIRQGVAIRKRREREAAEREAREKPDADAPARKKKRGWFG
ncbi:MAG: hypothetical protein KJ824_11420 [Alphaproteobacteria bacterium]|nr:hypothetical protein [Alphaproteobacteria bacterium]